MSPLFLSHFPGGNLINHHIGRHTTFTLHFMRALSIPLPSLVSFKLQCTILEQMDMKMRSNRVFLSEVRNLKSEVLLSQISLYFQLFQDKSRPPRRNILQQEIKFSEKREDLKITIYNLGG